MKEYSDFIRETLWFQVVDKGDRADNWNDTSGSAMFLYAIIKAEELRIIDHDKIQEVVERVYQGTRTKAVVNPNDGLIDIVNACDGVCVHVSYDVYINYPQKVNAKEVVPGDLWASWIVEKPAEADQKIKK